MRRTLVYWQRHALFTTDDKLRVLARAREKKGERRARCGLSGAADNINVAAYPAAKVINKMKREKRDLATSLTRISYGVDVFSPVERSILYIWDIRTEISKPDVEKDTLRSIDTFHFDGVENGFTSQCASKIRQCPYLSRISAGWKRINARPKAV